MFLKNSLVE